MCTPLEPLRRVHDSSWSARLPQANFCSIVRTGYSAVCGGISLTCGGMLKRFPRIYGVIDENAFHGRLMRCPYINYSWDKGKRLWRYWRQCIPPQVNEIPPGKNSLRALVISELKIRRRRDSTTADLVEGAWGEVAVAMARKIALRKLARRRVVVAPFPVEV